MISATSSLSPYSYYSPTLNKPTGQAGGGATEKITQGADSAASPPKNDPEAQAAQKDPKAAQEKKQVDELKKMDQRVRAHEQAHLSAAAGLAMGGATFSYRRGPDGHQYAVGGEVQIDVSPGKTPQETISKAQRIKAAALAPADPSAQDRAVASQATQMALQAQQELAAQRLQGANGSTKGEAANDAAPPSSTQHRDTENPGMDKYRQNSASPPPPSGSHINSYA